MVIFKGRDIFYFMYKKHIYWEVQTIPTSQRPLDYTVGVGVKQNSSRTDSIILGYGTNEGLQTALLE